MNDEAGDVVDQSLDRMERLINLTLHARGNWFATIEYMHECCELVSTLKQLYPKVEEPVAHAATITVDVANTESVVKIMDATKTMLQELESIQPDDPVFFELNNAITKFKAEVFHEWTAVRGSSCS